MSWKVVSKKDEPEGGNTEDPNWSGDAQQESTPNAEEPVVETAAAETVAEETPAPVQAPTPAPKPVTKPVTVKPVPTKQTVSTTAAKSNVADLNQAFDNLFNS